MSEFSKIKKQVSIGVIVDHLCLDVDDNDRIICPNPKHQDIKPSCKLYKNNNTFYCYSCRVHGDIFELFRLIKGCNSIEALNSIRRLLNNNNLSSNPVKQIKPIKQSKERKAVEPPVSTDELKRLAMITHYNLMKQNTPEAREMMDYLLEQTYILRIIEKLKLGLCKHTGKLTIPIIIDGVCYDIRRYNLNPKEGEAKYLPWKTGTGKNRFLGMDLIKSDSKFQEIYLCSGISDLIVAQSHGLLAICPTTGENSINKRQLEVTGLGEGFRGNLVFYIPDTDEAGQATIPVVIEALKSFGCICVVIDLSEGGTAPKNRKDLKDFFKEGKTIRDFERIKHNHSEIHFPVEEDISGDKKC